MSTVKRFPQDALSTFFVMNKQIEQCLCSANVKVSSRYQFFVKTTTTVLNVVLPYLNLLDKGISPSSVDCNLHLSKPISLLIGNDLPDCFNVIIPSEANAFLSTLGCV